MPQSPSVNVFVTSFQQFLFQLVYWIPKLIVALLIWYVGKYFLGLAINWLKKVDIPGTKLDDKLIEKFGQLLLPVGKFLLALIILDYFGIGESLISAVVSGMTYTVAIALGLAFGRALEPEAKETVERFKKYLK